MNKLNRRTFIQQTGTASLMAGAFIKSAWAHSSPNDTVNIAIMGINGRGGALMEGFAKLPNVNVATICDIDENLLPKAVNNLEKVCGKRAKTETDIRRVLENKDIDAIAVAAPNHWHALATIWGCQAGKDVYVEKPVSWSITEGRRMIEAARKYDRIVQTGTQQRSWEHWILAKQLIDEGKLGQITFVHTYWYQHARAGTYADVDLAKLDWTRWLGPARDQPFRPERFFQWRHYWDFGGGCLTDLMTHWIDVVHWYMGVDAPLSATTTARNYNISIWEAPDTVTTSLEFPNDFMAAYLGTYVSRIDDGGLEFRGDRATLKIDRARLAVYRDDSAYAPGTLTPEPEILVRSSRDGSLAHLQNWIDCVRSRRTPNAPIRVGHAAARTSHIANAALRQRRPVRWNAAAERIEPV
jgi:predicted dehydrogenase